MTEVRRVVDIDGLQIDAIGFNEAVATIAAWAADGSGGYVCTPNVDHIVQARRNQAFRAAVAGARLRVPDGMGIVYGSRIAGTPLPGTVTGRLLPAAVGEALARSGHSIALYGGHPGAAHRAARALGARGVSTVPVQPPMELEIGSVADVASVAALRATSARVAFVALGSPKQELWMAAHTAELPGMVLVGVGAAIEILAGEFRAAPNWMTRVGLEWAWRLVQEPRRLARRYLWDDPRFLLWMLQARLRRASTTPNA